MNYKELIDKRVVIVASVIMLFMLTTLLAIYPQRRANNANSNANSNGGKTTQGEEVLYAFNKTSLSLSDEMSVDVLLKAKSNSKVSGATVMVNYPKDLVVIEEDHEASASCSEKNNKLDTVFAYRNDEANGVMEITRTALVEDEELPSGEFCFGTLHFKSASNDLDSADSKEITFTIKSSDVSVVGPKAKYVAKVDPQKGKLAVVE